jgi:simple sugar transport system ATP-binding protein/D-xylose transport system ATP-binding protein
VTPALNLTGITKSYGGVHALRGIDMSVSRGEVVALVGDNGAGKSSLINVLSGNLRPDSGSYEVDGRPVHFKGPGDATDLGIQTVYQDLALCENLDAVANLFLGREKTTPWWTGRLVNRAWAVRRCRDVFDDLGLNAIPTSRPVQMLSGGQRQNVAIARSVLWEPSVVLLDEPTAALSIGASRHVGELILRLKSQNRAVVLVSHDIHNLVMDVADRVDVLRLGQLVASYDRRTTSVEEIVGAIVGSAQKEAA